MIYTLLTIIILLILILFGSWMLLGTRYMELATHYKNARTFIVNLGMYEQYQEFIKRAEEGKDY